MIQRFPDPQLLACLLEVMPHLIQLQDDGVPCGLWLLLVRLGNVSDPVEDGRRRDPEEARDAVHGDPTQVEQDSVDPRPERLPAWGRAGELKAAPLAELVGFPGDRAIACSPSFLQSSTTHRLPAAE